MSVPPVSDSFIDGAEAEERRFMGAVEAVGKVRTALRELGNQGPEHPAWRLRSDLLRLYAELDDVMDTLAEGTILYFGDDENDDEA